MRQVLAVSKTRRLPSFRQWLQVGRLLSRAEKQALAACALIGTLSVLFLGGAYVLTHQVEVPATGGTYVEGLVGDAQFVNPLYTSASNVDADIARLVYSGLMRWDAQNGLVNDLATEVKRSEDGKIYTVTLRKDAVFQNGDPLSVTDVLFTFEALKNPLYRSPLSAAYQLTEVSQTDEQTVVFTLKEPYAPFLSLLTIGILPSGVWSDIAPRNVPLAGYNLKPIGSGPYAFKEFAKDKKGSIKSYTLIRNEAYYGTKPLIDEITFKFYPDAASAVKALEAKNIEGLGFVPQDLEADVEKTGASVLLRPSMPRQTALFFNQTHQPLFKTKELRQAIALVIDRDAIVRDALNGHAEATAGVMFPESVSATLPIPSPDITAANKLLDDAGFPKLEGATFRLSKKLDIPKKGKVAVDPSTIPTLSVTLTTVQTPEFNRVAQLIATQLATIGIEAKVEAIDSSDLLKTVIEPRNYDLLLTGILYGMDPDPYSFWHSSQATDKGLNLAGYTNKKADDLIDIGRKALDLKTRTDAYTSLQTLVADDVPAVFLYRPTYTYAIGASIRGVALEHINAPVDRFADITNWYIKTRKTLK